MSIFDSITEAVEEAATDAVIEREKWEDFDLFSGNVEPSEDFVFAVTPETIKPRGFQLAAAEAVLRFGRGVIGFAPGMGKTLPAQLVAAERHAATGARTVAIVPPTLRLDPWVREFNKEFPSLKVVLLEGRKAGEVAADADVVVVPDSIVSARAEDIIAFGPEVLLIDEAQRFKNREAKRTKGVRDIAAEVAKVEDSIICLLTGTLAVNRPDEIWSPVSIAQRAAALSGGDSWTAFMDKWCHTETIWTGKTHVRVATAVKDIEALHRRLRETSYIRVERDEVLDMPDKVWAVRNLALPASQMVTYRRVEREFLSWLKDVAGEEAMLRAAKAETITRMTALRKEAAAAKVEATAEYVEEIVAQGEPVVLMGWHTSAIGGTDAKGRKHDGVIAALRDRGIEVAKVVGGMTAAQKTAEVDRFKSGEAQVLVGQIVAAGTGLNLENAAHLVFMELPWSPGDLTQASDRIYRVTQRRDCTIHVLNAESTIDQEIWAVINAKAEVVDQINAGQVGATIDPGSVQEEVLSRYL